MSFLTKPAMQRLVPAFVLLAQALHAQDFSLFEQRTFTNESGETIPFRLLLPESYSPATNYPLVLFLHGAGERGDDNHQQLVNGVRVFLDPAHRRNFPCIVAAPQCPTGSYWASVDIDRSERPARPLKMDFNYTRPITPDLQIAIDLTRHLLATERADPRRTYVAGISMGGMGTLEAVARFPDLFTAAVPVCGGGDPKAFGKKQAGISFWLFHGADDDVVGVEHSRTMVALLKELGAEVRYTEYPGVKHNSWDAAFADPDLLPWLFRHSR